ncbi:MAG: class I SAM-dependent methyltransferase [Candidatus Jettenia sp.]|nr:class I SAM-dependent methyltransferase [Candidatus Jettenia sp.]
MKVRSLKSKRIDFIAHEYSHVPVMDFVKAVNDGYYNYNACEYDSIHPDITYDAIIAWDKITDLLRIKMTNLQEYTIVDIGSGTGFVAARFLEKCLSFKNYIGLEPSASMRKVATKKFRESRLSFQSIDILKKEAVFDVLKKIEGNRIITLNSVLHHIVWWEDFLTVIKNALNTGDLFILCHEPNSRFWENNKLVSLFDKIQEEKARMNRRAVYLNPINYIKKVNRLVRKDTHQTPSRYDLINQELKKSGAIKNSLSPGLIGAIIDYSVPLCWRGITIGKDYNEGFLNIEDLMENYFKDMELLLSFTYQHLAFSSTALSTTWRHKEKVLEKEYPLDGAQFCLILQKN